MKKLCLLVSCISALIVAGCNENATNSQTGQQSEAAVEESRETKILGSGDILVLDTAWDGSATVSYVSKIPATKALMSERILSILKEVNADDQFIKLMALKLSSNRRISKDNFTLPLKDPKGTEHWFTYTSDFEQGIYTIKYQSKQSSKS